MERAVHLVDPALYAGYYKRMKKKIDKGSI